jgi:hypothetical protein
VAAEAERRRPLVAAIDEVEAARVEAAWLREYEADANRFKVRPAVEHAAGRLLYPLPVLLC